jgi:hypothetical protein
MTSTTNQDPFHSPGKPPSSLGETPPPLTLDGDTYRDETSGWNSFWNTTAAAAIPSLGACLKATLGVTVALYILNQKHLLPRPLSAVVSQALFWPTLPITVAVRLGKWETVIDDTVVMGGAPFGFARLPEKLYEQYGVRTVIHYSFTAVRMLGSNQ